ncbi:Fasciclin-like arabinogalactan protein 7 [Acorus calamus]|uniref:Fasciclin-like arabinogalactan protein 7 n=1 Tax=Acorus calamus TaxID=4465 RepID=A0AAV9CR17_ACOCL|nr:Fasciclin-like arabinogalactan protein 7 [Acorus calamus]
MQEEENKDKGIIRTSMNNMLVIPNNGNPQDPHSNHSTRTLRYHHCRRCLQISNPFPHPGPCPCPLAFANLTHLFTVAGPFHNFLQLLQQTQVIQTFQNQANNTNQRITIFVPQDLSFSSLKKPSLSNLTSDQLRSLLLFHALPQYYKLSEFTNLSSSSPVDQVLLPVAIFGVAPPQAPSPPLPPPPPPPAVVPEVPPAPVMGPSSHDDTSASSPNGSDTANSAPLHRLGYCMVLAASGGLMLLL